MYRAGVFGAWYRADDGFAIIRRFLGRSSGMAVRMRIGSFVLRVVVMRSVRDPGSTSSWRPGGCMTR